MENQSRVIGWNTHKVSNGFQFNVYSFGYQVETVILKTGVLPSRARAVLVAKKWTMFLKSQAQAA